MFDSRIPKAIMVVAFFAAIITLMQHSGAHATAEARPKSAPAKGTKECTIAQVASEHLTKIHDDAVARAGVPFYMQTMSYLKFRVLKSGSITVSIAEDTYPGSRFYVLIGGRRYSGDARYQLPLDAAALAALKADKLIQFTYTDWPYRTEISRDDIFTGFAAAYDECRAFLSPGSAPSRPRATSAGAPLALVPATAR